jgi:hypothetical protein
MALNCRLNPRAVKIVGVAIFRGHFPLSAPADRLKNFGPQFYRLAETILFISSLPNGVRVHPKPGNILSDKHLFKSINNPVEIF